MQNLFSVALTHSTVNDSMERVYTSQEFIDLPLEDVLSIVAVYASKRDYTVSVVSQDNATLLDTKYTAYLDTFHITGPTP